MNLPTSANISAAQAYQCGVETPVDHTSVPLIVSPSIVSPDSSGQTCDHSKRRALFISYAFPPTGGGGVQRAVKFVKYLPDYGWAPTVLTVANPSVPVRDVHLGREVHPNTAVVRAKTWEPNYSIKRALVDAPKDLHSKKRAMYAKLQGWLRCLAMHFLQPDPQVLWNGPAYRAAVKVLLQDAHAAIFVTAPPFSSLLLGERLKRRFGLPLILDFRDEWLLASRYLDNYQIGPQGLKRQEAMMRRVLRSADAVVTTTQASANELEGYCRQVGSRALCRCIFNGFDPHDFNSITTVSGAHVNAESEQARFQIIYTGTLWRLTDVEPLVQALELLDRVNPGAAASIELLLIGRRSAEQELLLQRLVNTRVSCECLQYMPHDQALQRAASADCLLLLLADQPGAERVVPAKLFEYLALNKSILGIVPAGETHDILVRCGHTNVFSPKQPQRIAEWLQSAVASRKAESRQPWKSVDIARYSRPHLTRELSQLLTRCIANPT